MDLMMSRVQQQLELQGITIEMKKSAKELLLEKGYDSAMGARPMRRCIQNLIEDPISEKLISGEVRPGQKIEVSVKENKMHFDIKKSSRNSVLKV
jgi:ATP-dependent Clp protease ATP-binding subunit ClpC